MKPRVKPQESGMEELFRSKLKNIINLRHELMRLGELIDWARLEAHFAPYYKEAGRPGLPIRLLVGLHLLKHIEGLSDEAVCARWERDPYMQYFCGEEYFQHAFPLERSGMTHFRNRVGEQARETTLPPALHTDPSETYFDVAGVGDCATVPDPLSLCQMLFSTTRGTNVCPEPAGQKAKVPQTIVGSDPEL
jgi:hypothetical protein